MLRPGTYHLRQFHAAIHHMPHFDPATPKMPCGHFIGGGIVEAPAALTVTRPSDGCRRTARHAVQGTSNGSFVAAGPAIHHQRTATR